MSNVSYRDHEREEAMYKAKKSKRKRRKKQTAFAFFIILAVAVLTLIVLSFTVFFKAENIKVSGCNMYTAEEIISTADISTGDNLLLTFLKEKRISEKLQKKLPFISGIEIELSLPDTFIVKVKETKEELCFSNGKKYYSSNVDGKIISEFALRPQDLLLVTVSEKTAFLPGEILQFETEREKELFEKFTQLVKEENLEVNFINISEPYNSYIKIEDRIIVKFGSSSYFENKVAYLKAALNGITVSATGVFDLSGWTPENNQPVMTYGDISEYEK